MSDLGNYIKEKRIQAGLSYKELSIMTGISDTSLQRMETGKTGMPIWENICSIAKALIFNPFEIMQTAGYIRIIKLSINGQMIMMQVLVKHTDITFVVMNHRLCIMKISASLI